MENGDGSVMMKVSGTKLRYQKLFVNNLDIRILLVSAHEMCSKSAYTL